MLVVVHKERKMFKQYRKISQCKTINHFLLNIKKRKKDIPEYEVANDFLINWWYKKLEGLL